MRRLRLILTSIFVVATAGLLSDAAAADTSSPISSSQNVNQDPYYTGSPATAQPLPPVATFNPPLSGMHGDAGNTKATDNPGPLGVNPVVKSASGTPMVPMMWDNAGQLTAGCIILQVEPSGNYERCLEAVNPSNLAVEAQWVPPSGQDIQTQYLEMNKQTDQIVVASTEGHLYLVQRTDTNGVPGFTTLRDIDLVAAGAIPANDPVLAADMDSEGNLWFSTGAILKLSGDPDPDTTIGYVTPSGNIYTLVIPNQIVENGLSVNQNEIFVVTGPAGSDNTPGTDDMGLMTALHADPNGGVDTDWQQPYDAGDANGGNGTVGKPGGFARGSGSTPTLLGNDYVAITDNANTQVNLLVYRQSATLQAGQQQLVCSVPLFQPNASANDIGMIGVVNGTTDSLVALNDYNAPVVPGASALGNDATNNMDGMAPGVERVDVNPGGNSGCTAQWDTPIRIKSVPFLSTQTGLIYGYAQDPALAAEGQYVWSFVALNFQTGAVQWQVRAGAGGVFNDSYLPATLGPDGTLYQGVIGGTVLLKDSAPAVPGAPTNVVATAGNAQATVNWTAPPNNGNPPVTQYTVTANDSTNAANGGQTVSGTGGPLTVTNLTNGDTYTFSVTATNSIGTGAAGTSNAVTPPNPRTQMVLPANGASLAGNQYLDASAQDTAANVTKTEFDLTGGSYSNTLIATATATYYGWIAAWNSATVPDGTYTLQSRAYDAIGNISTSNPITIHVDNTPPTTSVVIPSTGATANGSQVLLDAGASDNQQVTKVEFHLTGGSYNEALIATATPTYYGWLAFWNSTKVPDGTYTVQSEAYDAAGNTTLSTPVTISLGPTTNVLIPSNGATGKWLSSCPRRRRLGQPTGDKGRVSSDGRLVQRDPDRDGYPYLLRLARLLGLHDSARRDVHPSEHGLRHRR